MIGFLLRKITDFLYYLFGDTVNFIRFRKDFIFQTLTQRALEMKKAIAFIGLRFFPFKKVMVLTGEEYIEGVVSYQDPHARRPFKPLSELIGHTTLIDLSDPQEARQERHDISKYLKSGDAAEKSCRIFTALFDRWDEASTLRSLNDKVDYACAQIISSALYDIEDLPEEIVSLLYRAEHAVFNRDEVTDEVFSCLQREFKALNDRITKDNEGIIAQQPRYIQELLKSNPGKEPKDLNLFMGLIVIGNIAALLTGVMILLAERPVLLEQLKTELELLNWEMPLSTKELREQWNKAPFLHRVYLEALRYFAPAGPVVRESSRWGKIADITIPPSTHLILPIRALLRHEGYWKNQGEFDPFRKELDEYKLNKPPFIPFSMGERICPASFGFAEAIFKTALVVLVKGYELRLTGERKTIECLPALTHEARLSRDYFVTLQRNLSLSKKTSVPPTDASLPKISRSLSI